MWQHPAGHPSGGSQEGADRTPGYNYVTPGAELSAPTSFLSGALTSYSGDEQRPGRLGPYRSYGSLFLSVWLQHADKC